MRKPRYTALQKGNTASRANENAAYADAVKLIDKVGAIMEAQHRQREYSYYVDELRARFKPKAGFY